jgi:hypothetical protein
MKSITALLALSAVAVMGLISVSCQPPVVTPAPQYSNNLKYVRCKKNIPGATGPVEIPVYGRPQLDRDDEVYFVCVGEQVHWLTRDAEVVSFTVQFKDPTAWPFSGTPAPLPEGASGATVDQTVAPLPAGRYSKAYEYRVTIQTRSHGIYTIDPHVIPM